jgi:hypothetical protein
LLGLPAEEAIPIIPSLMNTAQFNTLIVAGYILTIGLLIAVLIYGVKKNEVKPQWCEIPVEVAMCVIPK